MSQFDTAFEKVCSLVEDFKANEKYYLSPAYQEKEVRDDFINKFFVALGWDVQHNEQKNPYEQEVKVERGVSVSGAQKRADYSFSISPNFRDPKFYVEAKKPSKDLYNADYYFQTIRYGWHKATPLAVLTDFEEFHILDCRFSPDINTILNRKIQKYHYSDYTDKEKFAEIYWLFSREAVANNSLEKRAENLPKLKGRAAKTAISSTDSLLTIDEAILIEIDGIREKLAKAFKKNDENLNSEDLTEATQRTINRLVFIRFLEDKLIEQQHYVSEFGKKEKNVWKDFISTCRKLDVKYNGVVFKRIFIDEDKFKGPVDSEFYNICQGLCHLHSRFLFNAIPIYILGSIYERFLGKVVNATDKRVKIEEKPEVRKAGGVFYTPKYIVDYIVRNTVGKLIEGKTPEQIAKMRFIDISSGSGSFAIGMFESLLDYHSKYYQKYKTKAKADGCIEKDGMMVLSIKQKQKILVNNIYGVDIDSQAVEVTLLSLYLKLLEDETTATANEMQVLFHEKILPIMSKNIICGNSLIGTDILSNNLFADNEERKLNPMDFETAFPDIMRNGGFDAVVGNPPYVQQSMYEWFNEVLKEYLLHTYCSSMGRLNTFGFFIERAIKLINNKGFLGYIIPNTILTQEYYEKLRLFILSNAHIEEIINYDFFPFKDAVVETVTLIISKNIQKDKTTILNVTKDLSYTTKIKITEEFKNNYKNQFSISGNDSSYKIKDRLKHIEKNIGDLAYINQGIALKQDRASYIFDNKINSNFKPIIDGREINKYELNWNGKYLKYDINAIHSCKREDIFNTNEKILFRRVSSNLIATIDTNKFYTLNTLIVVNLKENIEINLKFLLGIINSKLVNWYYTTFLKSTKKVFSEIQARQVEQIPIPTINFNNKSDKSKHDKIVQLVDQILQAKKQLQTIKTDKDKTYFEQKCTNLEIQIDKLVYELYGLTKEEIDIVESK